jgi:hypothetical protein
MGRAGQNLGGSCSDPRPDQASGRFPHRQRPPEVGRVDTDAHGGKGRGRSIDRTLDRRGDAPAKTNFIRAADQMYKQTTLVLVRAA